MKIGIATENDNTSLALSAIIVQQLSKLGHEIIEVPNTPNMDLVDLSLSMTDFINNNKIDRGIIIDQYAVAPYMACNKVKGIIAASVSDEFSAKATRDHNSTQIICLGSKIVGEALALNVVNSYINSIYSAGRHQIRIDMLNKML